MNWRIRRSASSRTLTVRSTLSAISSNTRASSPTSSRRGGSPLRRERSPRPRAWAAAVSLRNGPRPRAVSMRPVSSATSRTAALPAATTVAAEWSSLWIGPAG